MRSQFTRSRHNRLADQKLIRGNFGLGDLYVVLGICFALLGAGSALDGFLRYRRFLRKLNVFFAPHPPAGETARLMAVGVAIAVLGVATALIIAIDRFG